MNEEYRASLSIIGDCIKHIDDIMPKNECDNCGHRWYPEYYTKPGTVITNTKDTCPDCGKSSGGWVCTGCDEEFEPHNLRVCIELSAEQREWLKSRLECEVAQTKYYRYPLKGETDILLRFILKLMNNTIRILNTTPKNSMLLLNPDTMEMVVEECERYLKEEPNVLKNIEQGNIEGIDKNQLREKNDFEMVGILLNTIEGWIDMEILCYQCIRNGRHKKLIQKN